MKPLTVHYCDSALGIGPCEVCDPDVDYDQDDQHDGDYYSEEES